ncbi:hypothetical protein NEMBOFW57_010892 [Staphylotrichum longicolle]|uniref:WSC domain-containing protein n=1 Tax=Staphylotrichum longicolle TaxID=669026 RepID=A0AAD4ENJ2_9PEZI|nr:hypothetical protein NEMBOFW57_010892 [Staphylotrichum longicolle]
MASIRSRPGLRAATLLYLVSLTTALPALGEFKYQGCYTNDENDAALKGKAVTDQELTLPKCAAICDGYAWFGVQAGSVCYCGTSLADSAVKRPEAECNVRCAGTRCQVCGGPERINVFWTGESTTTSASAEPMSTSTEEPPVETTTTEEPPVESTTTTEEPTVSSSSTTTTTTSEAPLETTTTTTSEAPAETTTTTTTDAPKNPRSSSPPRPRPSRQLNASSQRPFSQPHPCWIALPAACESLNNAALPYPVYTPVASKCSVAMYGADLVLPTALSSCFQNYNRPSWTPTAAYSCVATADVYCHSTTVCKDAVATPTAPAQFYRNALVADGEVAGFEDGKLWDRPSGTNSDESVIRVGVAAGVAHEGRYALKVDFSNTNGGSRGWIKYITLDPGVEYVASWWWWSENAQGSTTSRMQFTGGGGVGFLKDAPTKGGPTRQWVKVEQRFTTAASFGRVYFTVYGNRQDAANTFYVDDISITRV